MMGMITLIIATWILRSLLSILPAYVTPAYVMSQTLTRMRRMFVLIRFGLVGRESREVLTRVHMHKGRQLPEGNQHAQ